MGFVVERGEGISNADSFASVAEYLGFLDRYYLGATGGETCEPNEIDIERALTTAASLLSHHIDWRGCRVSKTQILAWPRAQALGCDKDFVKCCEIPREIVEANIILARQILRGEIAPFSNETDAAIESMSTGGYSVKFAEGGARVREMESCGGAMTLSADRFKAIRHLIKCFVKRPTRSITLRRS